MQTWRGRLCRVVSDTCYLLRGEGVKLGGGRTLDPLKAPRRIISEFVTDVKRRAWGLSGKSSAAACILSLAVIH